MFHPVVKGLIVCNRGSRLYTFMKYSKTRENGIAADWNKIRFILVSILASIVLCYFFHRDH